MICQPSSTFLGSPCPRSVPKQNLDEPPKVHFLHVRSRRIDMGGERENFESRASVGFMTNDTQQAVNLGSVKDVYLISSPPRLPRTPYWDSGATTGEMGRSRVPGPISRTQEGLRYSNQIIRRLEWSPTRKSPIWISPDLTGPVHDLVRPPMLEIQIRIVR